MAAKERDEILTQESQSVEWKWSWQDEFLKWICGYANTDGGVLNIGVNDDGYIVGMEDTKALLESLPSKITDKLGIIVSIRNYSVRQGTNLRYGNEIPDSVAGRLVNQYSCGLISTDTVDETDKRYSALMHMEQETPLWVGTDGKMEYLEISVPQYPFAISCDGRYYKRSGSTLRELKGIELQNFLLERAGLSWDAAPMPNLEVSDLSKAALDTFRRKAVRKDRMTDSQASVSDVMLLEDLKLIEDGKLTRAAALMFHPDPEKFATSAYIKIGYFAPEGAYGHNKSTDVIYDDTIHGPLIMQVDEAIEMLYKKYLKALISYDGLQRIETYLWPKEAFREVLLNAVNHKSYETGIPIQIKVYDDKIIIWNDGQWPKRIDVNRIYEQHPSIPHNPKLANVFYRSGEIEAWGSGFDKIKLECDNYGAPYPVINASPYGGVELVCNGCDLYMNLLKHGRFYNTYPEKTESTNHNRSLGGRDMILQSPSLSKEEQRSVDKMMEVLSQGLTEKEKDKLWPIVQYLQTHRSITSQEATQITGKGKTTVSKYFKRLIDLNVIDREGSSVSTVYKRK